MNVRFGILLLGLCLVGFLGGFGAKRFAGRDASPAHEPQRGEAGSKAIGRDDAASAGGPEKANAESRLRSTDSLADLLALEDGDLYGRLALWLLDASEDEMAAFWEDYSQRSGFVGEIAELIFVQWSRLNPLGALAAVEGDPFVHFAWFGWACHDPETALATAMERSPIMAGRVAEGIGEFHPEWLRANIDQIPEVFRGMAIHGFAAWSEGGDPASMLEFLTEHHALGSDELFRRLIRDDPWAAVEWTKKNDGRAVLDTFGVADRPMEALVANLQKYDPEILAAMVQETAPGADRRLMEGALFESLLEKNLEAALQHARESKSSQIALTRLSQVGLEVARTDPEQAYAIFEELMEVRPEPFNRLVRIRRPGGWDSIGHVTGDRLEEMVEVLLADDPERLVQIERAGWKGEDKVPTELAGRWARRDVDEFAEWARLESGPESGAWSRVVSAQLMEERRYSEAADWALDARAAREPMVDAVLRRWVEGGNNGEAARGWIESAELPEEERQRYRNLLETVK